MFFCYRFFVWFFVFPSQPTTHTHRHTAASSDGKRRFKRGRQRARQKSNLYSKISFFKLFNSVFREHAKGREPELFTACPCFFFVGEPASAKRSVCALFSTTTTTDPPTPRRGSGHCFRVRRAVSPAFASPSHFDCVFRLILPRPHSPPAGSDREPTDSWQQCNLHVAFLRVFNFCTHSISLPAFARSAFSPCLLKISHLYRRVNICFQIPNLNYLVSKLHSTLSYIYCFRNIFRAFFWFVLFCFVCFRHASLPLKITFAPYASFIQ